MYHSPANNDRSMPHVSKKVITDNDLRGLFGATLSRTKALKLTIHPWPWCWYNRVPLLESLLALWYSWLDLSRYNVTLGYFLSAEPLQLCKEILLIFGKYLYCLGDVPPIYLILNLCADFTASDSYILNSIYDSNWPWGWWWRLSVRSSLSLSSEQ